MKTSIVWLKHQPTELSSANPKHDKNKYTSHRHFIFNLLKTKFKETNKTKNLPCNYGGRYMMPTRTTRMTFSDLNTGSKRQWKNIWQKKKKITNCNYISKLRANKYILRKKAARIRCWQVFFIMNSKCSCSNWRE